MDTVADISQVTDAARDAARVLANATTQVKNRGLEAIAAALIERSDQILAANAEDVARGRAEQMSEGLLDRLALTKDRIRSIADAVHEIVALPDPVGQVVRGTRTDIGLRVTQERVPLGVVGIIYEARPNVTIDAATLAIKAGNAVILRGGSAAQASNRVLIEVCRDALASVGLPADAIQTVDQWGRAGARATMRARGAIDALIPRGGAGLINAVVEESRVPVIETGTGNCHLYVDASADLEAAEAIIMNAKTQRVGVCNAVETLLVHADVAARFLVAAITRLTTAGVTIHADGATRAIVDDQPAIHPPLLDRPHRGYCRIRCRRHSGFPRRGGRRRDRDQRLDAFHRRRPAGAGSRGRHLHSEAPRARPHGADGADDDHLDLRGRRNHPPVSTQDKEAGPA